MSVIEVSFCIVGTFGEIQTARVELRCVYNKDTEIYTARVK